MPILRRRLIASPLALLAGCTTFPREVSDSDVPQQGLAQVVVCPRYRLGTRTIEEIDIGLTRIESGKKTVDLPLTRLPNDQLSVLEVPPGVYFMRRLETIARTHRHTFDPRDTLFHARPGQINYPGDWIINVTVVSSSVSGTAADGYFSATYQINTGVRQDPDIASALRLKFPQLNSKLPLKGTRIENL